MAAEGVANTEIVEGFSMLVHPHGLLQALRAGGLVGRLITMHAPEYRRNLAETSTAATREAMSLTRKGGSPDAWRR
jgi:hypothetical protein